MTLRELYRHRLLIPFIQIMNARSASPPSRPRLVMVIVEPVRFMLTIVPDVPAAIVLRADQVDLADEISLDGVAVLLVPTSGSA